MFKFVKNNIPMLGFEMLERAGGLVHGVTTRQGGVSAAPFDSLNLAFGRDQPQAVEENLELGAYHRRRRDSKQAIALDLDHVYQLFPRLKERRRQLAGTLSGGEQQMLAIGRAFMARPKLLMLDEPSLGLAPRLVDTIMETILALNQEGLTILLVEQNARRALEIAHRGYVLETGRIVLQGRTEDLASDEDVRRAYLGRDYQEFTD